LLGDCALQHFVPLLNVLFARASVAVEVLDGGYDTIDSQVYSRDSELFGSDPDFIVLVDSVQHLVESFLQDSERQTFVARALDRIEGRWRAIEQNHGKALVLQANFVMPLFRAYGNYECKVPDSLSEAISAINRGLVLRAQEHRGVFLADADFLASLVGRRSWFDDKLWVLAKSYCALEHLPMVAQNVVDICLAARGSGVKCIVLDLDNTLWGGVIGDDGLEGIRLGELGDGEAFVTLQRFLLEMRRRGVLLAVCSKNERENALLPFREHPAMVLRESDITMFVANWDDKATNISLIKETLNIGYDSILFLDDNPFERRLVRELLPEVVVPELPEDPAEYVSAIAAHNFFEAASASQLDAQRAELYKTAVAREDAKHSFANIEDYLRSLSMEIDVRRFDAFNLPRISQLIQRSNQFNLATRRYSEAQCAAMMADEHGSYPFSVSLKDRFGEYGLISVVVVQRRDDVATIEEYLMSCRVLQRGVEHNVMNHIFSWAAANGIRRIEGVYIPTKKNGMVKQFYARFGFAQVSVSEDNGTTRWQLPVTDYRPATTFFKDVSIQT
jgi:FkbH-like protein